MDDFFCFICGKNADGGWVYGFPPAPSSHKLALCPEHNTPENQKIVIAAWDSWLSKSIDRFNKNAQYMVNAHSYKVTVFFTNGGVMSLPCISCQPTNHGTLCIHELDGATRFIPMHQIKNYSIETLAQP